MTINSLTQWNLAERVFQIQRREPNTTTLICSNHLGSRIQRLQQVWHLILILSDLVNRGLCMHCQLNWSNFLRIDHNWWDEVFTSTLIEFHNKKFLNKFLYFFSDLLLEMNWDPPAFLLNWDKLQFECSEHLIFLRSADPRKTWLNSFCTAISKIQSFQSLLIGKLRTPVGYAVLLMSSGPQLRLQIQAQQSCSPKLVEFSELRYFADFTLQPIDDTSTISVPNKSILFWLQSKYVVSIGLSLSSNTTAEGTDFTIYSAVPLSTVALRKFDSAKGWFGYSVNYL